MKARRTRRVHCCGLACLLCDLRVFVVDSTSNRTRGVRSNSNRSAYMPTRTQILEVFEFARYAVRRYWRRGAIAFGVLAVFAFAGTLVMPRTYYSEARMFVRFGRENQVDPTASGGQMVALYESRESEINSLIEILRSRAILDRVVLELSPEFVLYGKEVQGPKSKVQGHVAASTGSTLDIGPGTLDSSQPSRAHQLAVQRLSKDLSIGAPRKSNIITVACKARSPVIAQKIVAKLVAVYQEEHVRVHRSPGSYAFFEQQGQQSLTEWQKAARELADMKDRLGIVTVEGSRKKLEDQIADIDSRRLANQAELKQSQAKIESLETLIGGLPATIVTQEVQSANAAADGMRQTLYALEAQEVDLASKMQEGHPRLVALREQVRDLREILAAQPATKPQATEALNPSRQGLETSLLTEKSQTAALEAREQSLLATQEELRGELVALNAQTGTIDQLQQRVALAEANHKEYSQRLEQARINRTLDDERFSSISLVQPASFVATPGGPRRLVVLAFGFFVAGLTTAAFVVASAWFNPLIATAEQLAGVFDLPVAGVLSQRDLLAAAA
jgi:polysaccharide biosynthesis protein PslE